MDGYNVHDPDTVANNIIRDITLIRGMTLAEAARTIGKTPQNFHNMLRGQSRFRKKTAILLNEKFQYSIPYLTKGIGQLYELGENNPLNWEPYVTDDPDTNIQDAEYEPQAFGRIYAEGSLTPREELLNKYAKKYDNIYRDVDLTVSGRDFNLNDIFDEAYEVSKVAGIKPQSLKEDEILRSISIRYVLIKSLLNLKFIAQELESM